MKTEPYGRLPKSVSEDIELSLQAKAIYGYMAQRAKRGGLVYIGQRQIAKKLGTSQKTVSRSIVELLERKHIAVNSESDRGYRRGYKLLSSVFELRDKTAAKKRVGRVSQPTLAASAVNSRAILDEIYPGKL